jgi:hypothetical protein
MRQRTVSVAGLGKPETFDFLGFKHICGKTRKGRFLVLRHTVRKRMRATLLRVKIELRRRMHDPVPEVDKWLKSVGSHREHRWVAHDRRWASVFGYAALAQIAAGRARCAEPRH